MCFVGSGWYLHSLRKPVDGLLVDFHSSDGFNFPLHGVKIETVEGDYAAHY